MRRLSYCPFCGEKEDLTLHLVPKIYSQETDSKMYHTSVSCEHCGLVVQIGLIVSCSEEKARRFAISNYNRRAILEED